MRGWWTILIFICHWLYMYESSEILGIRLGHGGEYGVAGFFVISGFLNNKKYSDRKFNIIDTINFMIHKIKKLYILHLICMIPYLVNDFPIAYGYFVNGNKAWQNYVIDYGMNIMLLQSMFTRVNSVNGVSWFLSCIMILYLFTPLLFKVGSVIQKKKANAVFLIIFLMILCFLEQYDWTYQNPFFRVFQYMTGMLLAKISAIDFRYDCMIRNILLGMSIGLSVAIFALPLGNVGGGCCRYIGCRRVCSCCG